MRLIALAFPALDRGGNLNSIAGMALPRWVSGSRRLRRLGWAFAAVLIIAIGVAWFAWSRPLAGERVTPSGLRRNTAHYVPMRDGTRLAVEVWLPEDYASGRRIPTVFRATRYFRAREPGPGARILHGLGRLPLRHLLAEARNGHVTLNPMRVARTLEFPDDVATNGASVTSMSAAEHAAALGRLGLPFLVQASWLDSDYGAATLQRFESLPNPQTLLIGSWGHGGAVDVDPLSPPDKARSLSREDQFRQITTFMKQHLLGEPLQPRREIRYITLGERTWRTTSHWPPDGLTPRHWFFREDGRLETSPPTAGDAGDSYAVDFEATTGPATRWHQLNPETTYTNRARADERSLTYTASPLEKTLEVTGTPVLRLQVSSTASDGAFHAYLEDVAEDGRVTYVTEGILRALHRNGSAGRRSEGGMSIQRSFLRADASPLVPGRVATLEFELLPTSVVFREGHRIRIALAGADAGNFERVPAQGPVTWRVYRDPDHVSEIELPAREFASGESARASDRSE